MGSDREPLDSGGDVIRVVDDPGRIDAAEWNALLEAQSRPTPFMRLEYLAALHASGSAVPATGWAPRFITLHRGGRMVGAAPAYLKGHSRGEYVFDWAWAQAYQRHGLRYYPKLLVAVPFTPVCGARLLASDSAARQRLRDALVELARDAGVSSAHVLFAAPDDLCVLEPPDWLPRRTVQFHWTCDPTAPVRDFAQYLGTLRRDKRKKIAQERRRVAEAGVEFTVHEGEQIDAGLWDFFFRCYAATYRAHGSIPYLAREFFARAAASMGPHWVMFVARRAATPLAASLVAIDRPRGVAYGRYWGTSEPIDCLHFEACYYRPLEWCIAQGFARFEGGAQGEHKMARGLMPVDAPSAHWIADARFAQAIGHHLHAEGAGVDDYLDELRERSPFRNLDP